MAIVKSLPVVITLNENVLNSLIKRHRMAELILNMLPIRESLHPQEHM